MAEPAKPTEEPLNIEDCCLDPDNLLDPPIPGILVDTNSEAAIQEGLSADKASQLAAYIGMNSLFDALSHSSWDYKKQISEVIACAAQDENLSVKLQALKYINQLIIDSARMSGYLVSATRTSKSADGTLVTLSADIVASALGDTPIVTGPKKKPKKITNAKTKGTKDANQKDNCKEPEPDTEPDTAKTDSGPDPEGPTGAGAADNGIPDEDTTAPHRPPTPEVGQITFPGLAVPGGTTRPPEETT